MVTSFLHLFSVLLKTQKNGASKFLQKTVTEPCHPFPVNNLFISKWKWQNCHSVLIILFIKPSTSSGLLPQVFCLDGYSQRKPHSKLFDFCSNDCVFYESFTIFWWHPINNITFLAYSTFSFLHNTCHQIAYYRCFICHAYFNNYLINMLHKRPLKVSLTDNPIDLPRNPQYEMKYAN